MGSLPGNDAGSDCLYKSSGNLLNPLVGQRDKVVSRRGRGIAGFQSNGERGAAVKTFFEVWATGCLIRTYLIIPRGRDRGASGPWRDAASAV